MRLVGYIRVSSQAQVDDGQGLDIQEQAIRRWCRENRHRLLAVYRDEGVSGTKESREGLEEALTAVRLNGPTGWWSTASTGWLAR